MLDCSRAAASVIGSSLQLIPSSTWFPTLERQYSQLLIILPGLRRTSPQPIATYPRAEILSRLAGRDIVGVAFLMLWSTQKFRSDFSSFRPRPLKKSQADKPPLAILRQLPALQLRLSCARLGSVRRALSALWLLQMQTRVRRCKVRAGSRVRGLPAGDGAVIRCELRDGCE
jgi:hypothetical protein